MSSRFGSCGVVTRKARRSLGMSKPNPLLELLLAGPLCPTSPPKFPAPTVGLSTLPISAATDRLNSSFMDHHHHRSLGHHSIHTTSFPSSVRPIIF